MIWTLSMQMQWHNGWIETYSFWWLHLRHTAHWNQLCTAKNTVLLTVILSHFSVELFKEKINLIVWDVHWVTTQLHCFTDNSLMFVQVNNKHFEEFEIFFYCLIESNFYIFNWKNLKYLVTHCQCDTITQFNSTTEKLFLESHQPKILEIYFHFFFG